jgi:DNA-binding MarR family transcriptional regulator
MSRSEAKTTLIAPQVGPPQELLASNSFLLRRLGMLAKERAIQAFQPTGLSPYHHAVLAALDEEARETQATIADALGYDRSQLVGLRDSDDRRRHLVTLTPEGKKTLTTLRGIVNELENGLFSPLDSAERETLHTLLLTLATHHDPRCDSFRVQR